jgi:hypothetical protein
VKLITNLNLKMIIPVSPLHGVVLNQAQGNYLMHGYRLYLIVSFLVRIQMLTHKIIICVAQDCVRP